MGGTVESSRPNKLYRHLKGENEKVVCFVIQIYGIDVYPGIKIAVYESKP